jgi:hypothetical protein
MQEIRPEFAPRSRSVELGRVAGGGLGSVVALEAAGWPSNGAEAAWVGLGGLIVGLVLVFGVEYLLRLRAAVGDLHRLTGELESERQLRGEERELQDRMLLEERYKVAIAEVDIQVWGDAFNEAAKTGRILPLAAIMARREVTLKARNLDKPLPPIE